MKRHIWVVLLVVFGVAPGVAAALAAESADEAADDTAGNVFLGEQDLAERMEIWRNQYRRMTPGDAPLVQDVGTWPAAWEEFSARWDAAPAERDLATWLVPVVSERTDAFTVLRDADGNALWSGTTDFAKAGSESVTLTGALVDEEEWALYEAAREEVGRRQAEVFGPVFPEGMRGTNGPCTNGLRFTDITVDTNGDYQLDFSWETDGDVQVFCRAMRHECWTNFGVVYTNDENGVVTNDVVNWRQAPGEKFWGIPDDWVSLGVANVANGVGSFTDTNHANPLFDRVRFYAVAQYADSDNDGITDGEEWLWDIASPTEDSDDDGLCDYQERAVWHTDPYNPDTDGDGWTDGEEVTARTDPLDRLSATRLARGVLVHAVKYSGAESHQWIQLHCSGPRPVNVGGFRVQAAGLTWETVATLPDGTWMTPGHFLLIGDVGVTNADVTAELGLAGSYSGQPTAGVRLMAPEGAATALVDTMFYGTHVPFNEQGLETTGWLSETTNLWASATRHLERWNLGVDTDREEDWRHIADDYLYNAEDTPDSDGDDLTDEEEYLDGFDPLDPDMDGDGLLDGFEVGAGLDPAERDSDVDGTQDGDEESPEGCSYADLQEARGLFATVVYPAGWTQGSDLGVNGIVSFKLENIGGFAATGAIWEGGVVPENYTVDITGAASSIQWSKTLPNGHKVVKLFAVPDGTNPIVVTVTDGGPNPHVTTPEEQGADIRAAFCAMKLDAEIGGVGEEAETNPGVYVENAMSNVDAPRTPCRLGVSPRPPLWLPGTLSLTWDSDAVGVYLTQNGSFGNPLASPLNVPLAGFTDRTLWLEGHEAGETDVVWKWENQANGQDAVHVVCYEALVVFSDNMPCDGEEVLVTLEIQPQRLDTLFQGADWSIDAIGSGAGFDNPSGRGIELVPVAGNGKQWRIPNARWFASWGDKCYETSFYGLTAQCDFGSFAFCASNKLGVTVGGDCFNGNFATSNYWSGTIQVHLSQTNDGMWQATVSQGSFRRNIVGTVSVTAPSNSQFYAMVLAEENVHAQQYQDPDFPELSDLWVAQNVMIELGRQEASFVASSRNAVISLVEEAFQEAVEAETSRSCQERINRKCAIERDAKQRAGSSHCMSLECTYPHCSN